MSVSNGVVVIELHNAASKVIKRALNGGYMLQHPPTLILTILPVFFLTHLLHSQVVVDSYPGFSRAAKLQK
jgi:hypothetical protein